MARPHNIKIKGAIFCGLVIVIKTFNLINIRRSWGPKITFFCSEVIIIKTLNPIKTGYFFTFFSKAFLALGHYFSTPGVFLV